MGNQQPGRTRSDTYTRYERDGEDGRYVTLEQHDLGGNSHPSSIDERVRILIIIMYLIVLSLVDFAKT
jgi:hypothetical protein